MKKKNITAIVKELNVRMKKEPITLRYIHILVSVVFFSSTASLLFLVSLYFNQQFQTSLFLVKDLSYNPLTSLPPPHSSGNDVADEELMRRAAMASRGMVMNETNPKVAFMFLTRWNLPLSPLWEMFFKGNEGFYSIYVHSSPEFTEEPLESSVFYKKRILSKMYHEKAISTLKYNMRFGRIYNEKWARIEDDQYSFQSDCLKKMELDKITFANNAYRDKKAVTSFSSGKREINVHNLNHRMLHEAKSMDSERSLLKMLNPSKDDDSYQFSINQIEDQMWNLQRWMKWPEYYNNPGTMDREECERKVKELEWEKYQGFVNAPCKASLWNSLPSTKVLRNQIQAMETRDEEKRKMVLNKESLVSISMESSSKHMVSLLKIESPTSGWVKPLKDLLKTIDGVAFKIDKRSKTVYIYGKTNPEIILEKIAKAGQKAEIVWSDHKQRKKPLDNQRGHPMQQCNNYHQQYYNGPPPPWMYQQPPPYQSYALPPPYPLQLNPPPPLPVPSGSPPKEPAAKSFPPTPPPPKNFTMGDLHPGCGIM
ncbi:hypothetical protein DY000_02054687 [Brassica cretica]|uniref:HMA domain-containing protein n=1 Tax=Brassica cretica TaxID=69181 RepID=A0ABQ7AF66_BRACR|nr:hypothetical protein DY000_02054687 [Brassica cretica]